jgi:hypothetical protein
VSDGIAALADRPVSGRWASIVCAALLVAFAFAASPLAHGIYDSLDREPRALAMLRANADQPPPSRESPSHISTMRPAIVVLVDGIRLDEARALPAARRAMSAGLFAVVEVPTPTLSRPYYHAALTGVPPEGTGVRRNREGQRALVDSLADRVRAAGGTVAFYSEGNDWMPEMHASAGDEAHVALDALDEPLDAMLAGLRTLEAPALTVVHVLGVDETAHDGGIHTDAHRRALDYADDVLARVLDANEGRALVVLLSDHGHVASGGHGGGEPEVRRVPFALSALAVPRVRLDREMSVAEIAPTIAAWMGVPPPRSATAVAPAELAPDGYSPPAGPDARARGLRLATAAEEGALSRVRALTVGLATLLALAALGATKRAFAGFDFATLVALVLVVAFVFAGHAWIIGRPFSLSALDNPDRQAARLVVLGVLSAALAIGIATAVARRRGAPLRVPLRRASAAVGWAALTVSGLAFAWVGGRLGPWPVAPFAAYAPTLALASGAGAASVAAAVLAVTALRAGSS